MIKKVFAIFLAMLLFAVFVACDKNSQELRPEYKEILTQEELNDLDAFIKIFESEVSQIESGKTSAFTNELVDYEPLLITRFKAERPTDGPKNEAIDAYIDCKLVITGFNLASEFNALAEDGNTFGIAMDDTEKDDLRQSLNQFVDVFYKS